MVRALRRWRRTLAAEWRQAGPTDGEVATWAREEAMAVKRLVKLRSAGLDPNPMRDRQAEAEEREVRRGVEEVLARVVTCVVRGSMPSLTRMGEEGATRMGRRDLADRLAEQGRGPLRGGSHAVDRVLDVRRCAGGRSFQVLLRWRGAHEDEWKPWASCNALTKREAQVLIKRKFPPKPSKEGDAGPARGTRDRSHLRRGGPAASPARRPELRRLRRGAPPRLSTPVGFPAYSPGLAHQPGVYGAGAGRSVRGMPILWESPSPDALRGQKWRMSPGAVRAEGEPGKRRGSALADERLAKRRHEST